MSLIKPRIYGTKKAQRAKEHLNYLESKLNRSLGSRTQKEIEWKKEIDEIKTSNILIPCKTCGNNTVVPFSKWNTHNIKNECKSCTRKKDDVKINGLVNNIKMLVPEGYELQTMNQYDVVGITILKRRS